MKPLSEVTLQTLVPLPPWATLNDDGLQLTLKSGAAVTVSCRLNIRVKLPAEYVALLRIQNGGYTNDFGFPMKGTRWGESHVPLHSLAGIVTRYDVLHQLAGIR